MKISVLLPTRNGGRLLADCIAAVLDEEDPDIELVVSDNANIDETSEILKRWSHDARLKVVRQDTVLTVTENWLAAYRSSTGDYLVLIGDDDLVLPGFFARVRALLDQAAHPDCLTFSAYAFVMPAAIDGVDRGYYADPHFAIPPRFLDAGRLSAADRATVITDMYRFRLRLPLNLQSTVFSRVAAERLPVDLFRPPFPDHYALNALLMTAHSWACSAEQLITIGVTPDSFGHYAFSGLSERGLTYLGSEVQIPHPLPGSELITAMYGWLLLLQQDFPLAAALDVSRGDYAAHQVWHWIRQWRIGGTSGANALRQVAKLGAADWLQLLRVVLDPEITRTAIARLGARTDAATQLWSGLRPAPPSVRSLRDFADWVGTRVS